jgi:hypothetical protein
MFDPLANPDPEMARLARKFIAETAIFMCENWDNDALRRPLKSGGVYVPRRGAAASRGEPEAVVARTPQPAVGLVVGNGAADASGAGDASVLFLVVPALPLAPDLYVHWMLREEGAEENSDNEADAWQIWVPEVRTAGSLNADISRSMESRFSAGHRVLTMPGARARIAVCPGCGSP